MSGYVKKPLADWGHGQRGQPTSLAEFCDSRGKGTAACDLRVGMGWHGPEDKLQASFSPLYEDSQRLWATG